MAAFAGAPLSDAHLKQRLEMFICCRDLINKDVMSKSDPFVVVYMKQGSATTFTEIGRTEILQDNLNPDFQTQFVLDYYFEEEQVLRFDAYDEDQVGSTNLAHHDVLGSATMSLGEIVHEPGQSMTKKLMLGLQSLRNQQTNKYSSITIRVEQVATGINDVVQFHFSGVKLDKMDFFGKSDPFYRIQRLREDNAWQLVHESEVIRKTLNPTWAPVELSLQKICNCDMFRPLKLSVYDWDRGSDPDFIGEVETNADELTRNPQFPLRRQTDRKKNKTHGTLVVNRFEVIKRPTFLDYLNGGCEISLLTAIDFTGSNGHPLDPGSLHRVLDGASDYQQAIRAVGNILAVYDSDQLFPVWGFGAHMQFWQQGPSGYNMVAGVRHCFPLRRDIDANGQQVLTRGQDPDVAGIYNVERAYLEMIEDTTNGVCNFSGPTNFSGILDVAIAKSREALETTRDRQQYNILMILTDGEITDMRQTCERLVTASNENLPLSIIIVGVGPGHQTRGWSKMEFLDADDEPVKNSRGEAARRDIVQFVPFAKFKHDPNMLSKETLEEVPAQLVGCMMANGFEPLPPRQAVAADMMIQRAPTIVPEMAIAPGPVATDFDNRPLPPPWQRAYDAEGRVYYVHGETQVAQWEFPVSA